MAAYFITVLKSGLERTHARPKKAAFLASVLIIALVASYAYFPSTAQSAWWDASWQYRAPITIEAFDLADAPLLPITNFPVYVDLSNLGSHFFTNVRADGGDIRITNSSGTELPRELVAIDTGAQTGELHFKADSMGVDTVFYIYYGNAAATDYADSDTYGAENVWTNGYEMVLHMNSGTLVDSTANSNDSSSNTGTGATGKLGSATDFSGSTWAVVPHSTSIDSDVSSALTYSMWINSDAAFGSNTGALEKGNKFFFLFFAGAGDQGPLIKQSGANIVANMGTVSTGAWHHIAGVFDGSAGSLKAYLDGVLNGSTTGLSSQIDASSLPLYIGADDAARRFDGKIDEVRIQSAVRDGVWLDAEHDNQSSPNTFYSVGVNETAPDTDPPSPDPMTFATAPAAASDTSISMTATTASDTSTPVEYYFEYVACATNPGTGGTDSGWQQSTSYTDTGLQAGKCYAYRVKARDASANETAYSVTGEATTTDGSGGGQASSTVPVDTRLRGGVRLGPDVRLR